MATTLLSAVAVTHGATSPAENERDEEHAGPGPSSLANQHGNLYISLPWLQAWSSRVSGPLGYDQWPPETRRALLRLRTTVLRGAAIGLTLRGGLHLLTAVLHVMSKLTPSKRRAKRNVSAGTAVMDTLKYMMFLGCLGGVYVAVDEGLALTLGKERTSKWRALVAGFVAGQTLVLTGSKDRHYSLATYVLLRGLTLLIRCGNKQSAHPLLRRLLAVTRYDHGDTVLMCIAASQIIYSFIMMPSTLPHSYIRFLNKQAAKEPYVWRAVQEQALRNFHGLSPVPLKPLHGTPFQDHVSHIPCSFWHPGQSCCGHAASFMPHAYMRALGVYIPVYLVPAVLVHRQKLLQRPLSIWPRIAVGIGRSSMFLTLFLALAFCGVCLGFNVTGTSTGPLIAASVWVGGLATLVEKKSRRMELALYCLSRALESFSKCLPEWGVVQRDQLPQRLDLLLFSAGCAAIMHCYSDDRGRHRDTFRSKYQNVLDFVFGNTGLKEGSISHLPSNKDLLNTVHMRIKSYSWNRLDDLEAQQLQPHRKRHHRGHQCSRSTANSPRIPAISPHHHASLSYPVLRSELAGDSDTSSCMTAEPSLLDSAMREQMAAADGGTACSTAKQQQQQLSSLFKEEMDGPVRHSSASKSMRRSATEPCLVSWAEGRVHGGCSQHGMLYQKEPSFREMASGELAPLSAAATTHTFQPTEQPHSNSHLHAPGSGSGRSALQVLGLPHDSVSAGCGLPHGGGGSGRGGLADPSLRGWRSEQGPLSTSAPATSYLNLQPSASQDLLARRRQASNSSNSNVTATWLQSARASWPQLSPRASLEYEVVNRDDASQHVASPVSS